VNDRFVTGLTPPYYAVIFTNQLSETSEGYGEMGDAMFALATEQDGCLGAESTRDGGGLGITVSYWRDEAAIAAWKAKAKHLVAQKMGMDAWYKFYALRVAKVEREYTGPAGRPSVT
jgi:heme-degrading monooxygenase HmoA